MSSLHFNKLTPAEAERVAVLMEEAAEVIQICGKILRHGFESCHPKDIKKTTNRELLEKELGDLNFAQTLMIGSSDINLSSIEKFEQSKKSKIGKYLHHQRVNHE